MSDDILTMVNNSELICQQTALHSMLVHDYARVLKTLDRRAVQEMARFLVRKVQRRIIDTSWDSVCFRYSCHVFSPEEFRKIFTQLRVIPETKTIPPEFAYLDSLIQEGEEGE